MAQSNLTSSRSEFVALKGGLAVPLAALQLLWRLEDRGLEVRLSERGGLLVGPRAELTPDDRAAIREHKPVLVTLVAYAEEARCDG